VVGAKARELFDKLAKERHAALSGRPSKDKPPITLPEVSRGDARDAAGKAVGVSGSLIDHATKVLGKGTPELAKAVEETGKIGKPGKPCKSFIKKPQFAN
jgi:hypothetical protein